MAVFWKSNYIKQARKLAGWKQSELACCAGVHVQTVKYWERQPSTRFIGGYAIDQFSNAFKAVGVTLFDAASSLPPQSQRHIPQLCNARTRKGHPCKNQPYGNGRCIYHGGFSTGPKTNEGRQCIGIAQKGPIVQV